jgi:type I restriction enzyme S subunit
MFKRKAAGPYADEVRYKGGEPIAKNKKYVVAKTNKLGTIFSRGEQIDEALAYIEKWNMQVNMDWLTMQFKFTTVNQLETLATIDMAICDLRKENKNISLYSIKELINSDKEWKDKLEKSYFSDIDIQKAIDDSYRLFGG